MLILGKGPESRALAVVLGHREERILTCAQITSDCLPDTKDDETTIVCTAIEDEFGEIIAAMANLRFERGMRGPILVIGEDLLIRQVSGWGPFATQEKSARFVAHACLSRPFLLADILIALTRLRPFRPAAWRRAQRVWREQDNVLGFCRDFMALERAVANGEWQQERAVSIINRLTSDGSVVRILVGHSESGELHRFMERGGADWVNKNSRCSLTIRYEFLSALRSVLENRLRFWLELVKSEGTLGHQSQSTCG